MTNDMNNEMTIEGFCDAHGACDAGRKWALQNCTGMREAWQKLRPDWLVWVATRRGVLTDRELRLWAVWSARQVQHLMDDARSIVALDVAERHANGDATDDELDAAWDAAESAALDAARGVALGAKCAALAAAWAAERAAASAAWDAAWDAVESAAWAAERDAESAAWAAQARYLRENTRPNFETTI